MNELVRIPENYYDYKMLKKQFPSLNVFYSRYYDGTYYDKAYTVYYDEQGNELTREVHSWYG